MARLAHRNLPDRLGPLTATAAAPDCLRRKAAVAGSHSPPGPICRSAREKQHSAAASGPVNAPVQWHAPAGRPQDTQTNCTRADLPFVQVYL
jgi:hypothetical protein